MQDKMGFDKKKTGSIMDWSDVTNRYDTTQNSYFEYARELYKNYYMYNRERAKQLEMEADTWRTNIVSPLTHMFANNIYNMYLDSDISFDVIVRNKDKYNDTQIAQDILSWGEYLLSNNFSSMRDEIDSAIFDAMYLGTGYHTPTYVFNKTKVEWLTKEGKKESMEEIDDYASVRYVSPFNIMDFGATSTSSRRYVVERKLIPSHKIKNHYKFYGVEIKEKEIRENSPYDPIDREAVKKNMAFYNHAGGNDITNDDTYNISNKMVECFEVHDGYYFDLYINTVYHGRFMTLGPYKRIPYINTTFKKIPGMQYGLGVGFLVKPLQQAFDTILNYRIDNVKLGLNKMFFADHSINMFGNNERMKIKPGQIIKVSDPDAIREFKMTDVNQSAYVETDALFSVTQGMIGVSALNLGIQGKVERVSGGPELYKASADAQLNQFLRNVSRSMAETMKYMMIYTLTYTDPENIDKVLGPDNALKNLDIKDLIDDFSFDFNVTNQKLDTRAVKRNQLLELMRTGSQVGADGQPMFPKEVTDSILRSLIDTYDLDINSSKIGEDMAKMANDEGGMLEAVQRGMGAAKAGPIKNDANSGMRDLQQQGAGGVPPEMTTNPAGNNQFTSSQIEGQIPQIPIT